MVSDSPEQITKMVDVAAANSGSSLESPKEITGTDDSPVNPEISSPTAPKIKQPQLQPQHPKIEGRRHREPLDPVRTKRNALIFLSLLVALFTLATEWRYRSQPLPVAPLPVATVWHLSLLFSLLCLLWISFLQVTTRTHMVFLYLSHGVLLAVIAHLALSPKVGMLAVHLNSHVAAGFLGYALAERRLHEATERFNVPMPTNKQQAERLRGLRITVGLYCSLITVGAAVRVAWVARHADEYSTSDLLLSVLSLIPGILALWIAFVAALLRGALMGHGGLAIVGSYFGLVIWVLVLSVAAMGYAAATINVWIVILGMSGFFGYSLSVYDSYKRILGMMRDDKESDLKGKSSSSAESEKLLQPTTGNSDGSSDDGTAS